MDQVTKVRRHFKREEWKSILSECRASGMTVAALDYLMPWNSDVQKQCK